MDSNYYMIHLKGDCDEDEDCQEGLFCLQRDAETDPVSIYCVGTPSDDTDFCVPMEGVGVENFVTNMTMPNMTLPDMPMDMDMLTTMPMDEEGIKEDPMEEAEDSTSSFSSFTIDLSTPRTPSPTEAPAEETQEPTPEPTEAEETPAPTPEPMEGPETDRPTLGPGPASAPSKCRNIQILPNRWFFLPCF